MWIEIKQITVDNATNYHWKCERHNLTNVWLLLLLFCWNEWKQSSFAIVTHFSYDIAVVCVYVCPKKLLWMLQFYALLLCFSAADWISGQYLKLNATIYALFLFFVIVINVKSSKVFSVYYFGFYLSLLYSQLLCHQILSLCLRFQWTLPQHKCYNTIHFYRSCLVRIFMHISSDYDCYMLMVDSHCHCLRIERKTHAKNYDNHNHNHIIPSSVFILRAVFLRVVGLSFLWSNTIVSFIKYK